jgi:tRNA U34 5-methylaminomethyl-2-thiouridine-forming methyltransferase MnmC
MNQATNIRTTGDGSPTLYVPGLDEHYHSVHGAITESKHVFIGMGLSEAIDRFGHTLNLLEIGFGTGLNAWLTLLATADDSFRVRYTAIDNQPLEPSISGALQYPEQLHLPRSQFDKLHHTPWGETVDITPCFSLHKLLADWTSCPPIAGSPFHLVYYDAFGPEKQPDMWTEAMFHHVFQHMVPYGLLVTYTAKGTVRRAMQAAGFSVEKLQGPPGKREMVRGWREKGLRVRG